MVDPGLADRRSGSGLFLFLLGGFELRAGGRVLCLPLNAERLVAFLAIRDRPQLRATVSSTLWMDTTDEHAAANLRTALWRLRQVGPGAVDVHGNYLALSPDVVVDLHVMVSTAGGMFDSTAVPGGIVGVRALAGDLLPDWDEDWIRFERERLRQLRVHALECACARFSDAGRHGEAIDAGQAAVAAEPLRESAHRTLIRAHLAEGNVCEAKRQFDMYCSLLADGTGFAPSPALAELVAAAVAAQR